MTPDVILAALARQLGVRVRKQVLGYAGIGEPFTLCVRARIDDRSVRFWASETFVMIDAEMPASSPVSFAAGEPDRVLNADELLGDASATPRMYALRRATSEDTRWLDGAARDLVSGLHLDERERLLVGGNQTNLIAIVSDLAALWVRYGQIQEFMQRLPAKDHLVDPDPVTTAILPSPLNGIPLQLALRWSISDDLNREEKISDADRSDLEELALAIDAPMLGAIDRYLDEAAPGDAGTPVATRHSPGSDRGEARTKRSESVLEASTPTWRGSDDELVRQD